MKKEFFELLVIDDDDEELMLMHAYLNNETVSKVKFFYAVEPCISYLQNCNADNLPKVILTDLRMPCEDGLDLIRKVKSIEMLKNIFVYVYSNSLSKSEIEVCRKMGASDCFMKPVKSSDYYMLLSRLQQCMNIDEYALHAN